MPSFQLFFTGVEDPGWRKLLMLEDAPHVGITFSNLVKRLPKTKPYDVAERFPGDTQILLEAGTKDDPAKDWQSMADLYINFIEHNLDRLHIVSEFDALSLGQDWLDGMRKDFFDTLPVDKFMAVWHERFGLKELERLAERYERVAVVGSEVTSTPSLSGRLNSIVMKYGVQLHAVSVADPDVFERIRFATASTSSWLSPMRYGETILWDGNRLKRHPASMKDDVRKRSARTFERAGFDAELIKNDDQNEVARFTLWSYRRLEDYVNRRRGERVSQTLEDANLVTTTPDEDDPEFVDLTTRDVARKGDEVRNSVPVVPAQHAVLPVLDVAHVRVPSEQGEDAQTVDVPRLSKVSIRGCDSCYLATRCPMFEEGSACKFEIPVEIRSRDQLQGAMTAVIEMQFQRIAGARFGEELEGGLLSKDLSDEIERFFKLVKMMKDINDNREFLNIQVEAKGNAGVINRLFGSMIEHPQQPAIEQVSSAEILDAEVVEDEADQ